MLFGNKNLQVFQSLIYQNKSNENEIKLRINPYMILQFVYKKIFSFIYILL